MDIRIGVQNVTRELLVETDLTADEVAAKVAESMKGVALDLTDTKGRRLVIPASAIGYVEMGEEEKRRVGFGG